ncbi:tetratricopeptide repeat protein [Aurantimonas sp. HBX-1]|uniref:tetratricopeptide repeat protein n=1 Tax=Aurantimonas sp. HBX-1 TaxID=2906072 RepID=UPI001F32DE87|nr:tetratricopeptide repeat protein [Aurantimonas sp. HBX-1]UIJ70836.1 tetratricopeptide repeat protein [Aurantimonas sp. HBX-1]
MRYRAALFRSALWTGVVLAALPASAETVEPGAGPQPHSLQDSHPTEARLFATLKDARTEAEGRAAESAIWRHWMAAAPDLATRQLLERAMERRESYDFAGARSLLDEAIAAAPTYAEAWNQRGFVRFLQDDFDGALADVDQAIQLEPRHFAAMSGRAIILMRQGRFGLAQNQLRAAVAIHPFLKERSMIVPEPARSPRPPGVDL